TTGTASSPVGTYPISASGAVDANYWISYAAGTLTITAPSSNATLYNLLPSIGTLSPAFATGTTSYTLAVANSVTSIAVTPIPYNYYANITVNGTVVPSATRSGDIVLAVGANTITTVVTAQDGITIITYTITVTRAASADDKLSSLKMSKGLFSPAFAGGTTSYMDAVGNTITSVTVTPTTADPTATIKVNGTTVPSGTVSGAINLVVGPNTINVAVTAQDGTTTKTYTVTVTRAPSTNANLSSLKMSKGTFSPTFASSTTSYTDAVGNTIASVTVTPAATDPDATIKVNG